MHLYSRLKIGTGAGSGPGIAGSGSGTIGPGVAGSGSGTRGRSVVGSGGVPGLSCAREPPQSSSVSSSSGLCAVMLTARRTHCQRQHQRQLQSPDAQTLSSQPGSGLSLADLLIVVKCYKTYGSSIIWIIRQVIQTSYELLSKLVKYHVNHQTNGRVSCELLNKWVGYHVAY